MLGFCIFLLGLLCLIAIVLLAYCYRTSTALSATKRSLEESRLESVQHQARAQLWEARFLQEESDRQTRLQEWRDREQAYRVSLEEGARAEEANRHLMSRIQALEDSLRTSQDHLTGLQKQNTDMRSSLSIFACEMNNLEKQKRDNQAWLLSAKAHFETAFADMARQVLGKTTEELQHYHDTTLTTMFSPLRESLHNLEKTIQDTYHAGVKERFSLSQEIHLLAEKSHQMTQEAHALSVALRQNHKIQGSWGEMILENILEGSGLRRDVDFWTQRSFLNAAGDKRVQPDVVLHLPENKHIIVDAKVSLIAFEQYVSVQGEGDVGQQALKAHLQAVRQHIKVLSDKAYHEIPTLQTAGFVLMFIPVESAFLLALSQDERLFMDAWQQQIVMIGPTTLLATLRIIARMLSFHEYHENAQNMMRCATQLHDKAIGFLEEMDHLGSKLQGAQRAYDQAIQRLKTGRGSLVQQIENIQKLGVSSAKQVPERLRVRAEVSSDENLSQESVPVS